MSLVVATPALANQPGGGTTGANVTISGTTTAGATSGNITLSNGIISATIAISSAQVSSMTFNGVQTVSGNVYFSMDGGTSFEVPHNCVLGLTANTADMVDLSFKQIYVSGNTSYIHAEDIDVHYVLRRGATGLYVYAILNHPASYPDLSMGEWRSVWKLPNDSTNFYFEREYVDNFRHHDMLNYYEFTHSVIHSGNQSTRIAEIALAPPDDGTHVASTRAGLYNCKYEFSMEYNVFGAWGHASDTHQKGVWIIPGSFEFFNDGPTKQDLILAESYSLIHLGRNHYNGSSTFVPTGTAWSKLYGPWLLYCNSGAGADALWTDAQAQAQVEQAAWPYTWLAGNALYPLASDRGSVTGKMFINDALKPAVSGANAWVGLATPDGSGNYDWQSDSLNYQYWIKADNTGNFTIPNVRPGTYSLYAFNNGVVGQYSQANVTVSAGHATALGNLTWNVTHAGNWIAWEIGVPDRNATEFRHGTSDYYVPYIWTDFSNEFTKPLNFNVGSSNWANDWNYVHGVWQVGGSDSTSGNMSTWPWNINFDLPSTPASGNATLTIALAGSNGGHLRVYINDPNMSSNPTMDNTSIPAGGGDALLREGVHAKYGVITLSFSTAKLHSGSNTITLLQINGSPAEANYLGYDYISLEMPGSAPTAQPAVGRSFTWQGGQGANSWDVGTFINWSNGGGNATFNQGDVVTFNDTEASNPAVVLHGALKPNGISVNAAQNYTFSGNGSITGTTGLSKSGNGTLSINNTGTNNYTGATTISGGTLQINSAISTSANVTVQSGGTLSVIGNLTAGTVTINSGGMLAGGASANITASVINNGYAGLSNGGTLNVIGSVTNNGTLRLSGGTHLAVSGTFTNNGVLDLITGSQTLPVNFVNHGVVLDAGSVKVQGVTVTGGTVQLIAPSYAGHNFQLQWSPTLSPAAWQNVGLAQTGTGSDLTFTDSGGLSNGIGFYRILVSP